ncbi:MAG: hypothetical protein CYPHOPRED_003831 [Cyphobasidiales sp. Tagirdzhanova-0007]|nr:MAG: hypothetical protein CYPHOPRED_003831 [Cyphobasidiales sp. Tagirdzhanova-0007]
MARLEQQREPPNHEAASNHLLEATRVLLSRHPPRDVDMYKEFVSVEQQRDAKMHRLGQATQKLNESQQNELLWNWALDFLLKTIHFDSLTHLQKVYKYKNFARLEQLRRPPDHEAAKNYLLEAVKISSSEISGNIDLYEELASVRIRELYTGDITTMVT